MQKRASRQILRPFRVLKLIEETHGQRFPPGQGRRAGKFSDIGCSGVFLQDGAHVLRIGDVLAVTDGDTAVPIKDDIG